MMCTQDIRSNRMTTQSSSSRSTPIHPDTSLRTYTIHQWSRYMGCNIDCAATNSLCPFTFNCKFVWPMLCSPAHHRGNTSTDVSIGLLENIILPSLLYPSHTHRLTAWSIYAIPRHDNIFIVHIACWKIKRRLRSSYAKTNPTFAATPCIIIDRHTHHDTIFLLHKMLAVYHNVRYHSFRVIGIVLWC